MGLTAGTKLGPYEIQSLIGAGGMGEVYRARDTRLQRDVAIKVLPSSLAHDQERLRRFEQEARAVAALNHPNLLTVFDVGTAPIAEGEGSDAQKASKESPYIVSELLEGATLREKLSAGALRERKALDYAVQIARGLAAAHERGIVHRDLKPENIFITNDGRAKILDFGLAKLSEPAPADANVTVQASATQAGVVMGTIGYMSPEQVRGKPADARSDIFSFGVVVYEMLAGKKAFHGDTGADLMSAILTQDPAELRATNTEISPTLDHLVHHCLEKDPQQRFQSAGDVAFQLNELSGMRSSSATHTMTAAPEQKKIPVWKMAAIGAAVFAVGILATWYIARARAHTEPPKFVQLSFQQGFVSSARFLPDGQGIVCASKWGSDSETALYTGRLDGQGLRPLGVSADWIASVSKSGELLVLLNVRQVGSGYAYVGTLARVPLGGGAPRPVLENVQYAEWDPDGKNFAVVRFVPEKHNYRLEYPVGKVLYETAGWVSDPRFSRDGKKIAYLDHPIFGDDQGTVAVMDFDGHRKQLSGSYESTQGLAWSPDGEEIWYSAIASGVDLTLFATTQSGKVRPLLGAPGNVDIQDVLPDGKVLVDNVLQRLVLMVSSPDQKRDRDFTWMDWAYGERFSADGKQILFGDQHSGSLYGVFLRNMDGSPAVRLGDGNPQDLSADGKWALSDLPSDPKQLLLLPTGAGEPRQLTHSKISHSASRFLVDGRVVANGNESGHAERAYLVDLNGNETAITPEGILAAGISNDGKRLLVRTGPDTFQIEPIAGGPSQPVPQLQKGDYPTNFTADDTALIVVRYPAQLTGEIWRVELSGNKRTLLHTIVVSEAPSVSTSLGLSASRDGKNYAYVFGRRMSTEYLVEGLH